MEPTDSSVATIEQQQQQQQQPLGAPPPLAPSIGAANDVLQQLQQQQQQQQQQQLGSTGNTVQTQSSTTSQQQFQQQQQTAAQLQPQLFWQQAIQAMAAVAMTNGNQANGNSHNNNNNNSFTPVATNPFLLPGGAAALSQLAAALPVGTFPSFFPLVAPGSIPGVASSAAPTASEATTSGESIKPAEAFAGPSQTPPQQQQLFPSLASFTPTTATTTNSTAASTLAALPAGLTLATSATTQAVTPGPMWLFTGMAGSGLSGVGGVGKKRGRSSHAVATMGVGAGSGEGAEENDSGSNNNNNNNKNSRRRKRSSNKTTRLQQQNNEPATAMTNMNGDNNINKKNMMSMMMGGGGNITAEPSVVFSYGSSVNSVGAGAAATTANTSSSGPPTSLASLAGMSFGGLGGGALGTTGLGAASAAFNAANMSSSAMSDNGERPFTLKEQADLDKLPPAERRRQERNLREQQRSYRISQQIKDLRAVLEESNVPYKANKYSILVSVVEYIKELQARSIMLDAEHQKLFDTIRQTAEMASNTTTTSTASSGSEGGGRGGMTHNKRNMTCRSDSSGGSEDNDYFNNGSSDESIRNEGSSRNAAATADSLIVQGLNYHAVFDHCPFSLGVASLDGTILACNESFETLMGVKKSEILNQSMFMYIRNHQDIFEAMADLLKRSSTPAALSNNTPAVLSVVGTGRAGRIMSNDDSQEDQVLFWCGHVISLESKKLALHITLTSTADGNPKFFSLSACEPSS
jgi:PAS domain-containing protein